MEPKDSLLCSQEPALSHINLAHTLLLDFLKIHASALYPKGKRTWNPLVRRLSWPQSQSEYDNKEKKSLHWYKLNCSCPAHILVTVLTELPQLHCCIVNSIILKLTLCLCSTISPVSFGYLILNVLLHFTMLEGAWPF